MPTVLAVLASLAVIAYLAATGMWILLAFLCVCSVVMGYSAVRAGKPLFRERRED